jgi:formiminotetrahydrofolate cyclodeaminase
VEPDAAFRDLTVGDFVDRLASAAPVPGGGSAAAVAGSLGAALVAMVAALSDRPKYVAHAALHAEASDAGRRLADRFLTLADDDSAAYARYGAAMKLPRGNDEEAAARMAAIREAARRASEVPFRTVEACRELVGLAEALAGRCNANAASDLEVASLLAVAASHAAAANVSINLPSIGDDALAADLEARTRILVDEIDGLAAIARRTVHGGEARDPLPAPG